MKKAVWKALPAVLILIFCFTGLSACSGGDSGDVPEENCFKYWIFSTDDMGIFYTKYEENPGIQWINNQNWDTEKLTLGSERNGQKIALSFQVPISGSEGDNFNTMIATGEYPEVLDLSLGNPRALFQDGVLIEITEYVHKYLPNYLAYLDEHPELKPFARDIDENGNEVYFALYSPSDNPPMPWKGYMYRRDWVVKYAKPTAYIWDWDSDYVKQHGHPKATPLSAAESAGDFTGWKKNDVTAFTAGEGTDPNNDYTDNVIFPSGKEFPYTISDWEWMFEAFKIAIEERGFGGNANAYVTSLFYMGHTPTGELVSSFGGGNSAYFIDKNRQVQYGATGENFRTYLEAMHNWYGKGWMDTRFETRSGDMFFDINPTGYNQGMVGLWDGMMGTVGVTIRATCINGEDKQDAMVFPCPLPINDMYGTAAQKFVEPDCLYQGAMIDFPIGFTNKCAGKNMEALFAFINWRYSFEGGLISAAGLSLEQYNSMTFEPDVYANLGFTQGGYTIQTMPDGIREVVFHIPPDMVGANATKPIRLGPSLGLNGNRDKGYIFNQGYKTVINKANEYWMMYTATAATLNYSRLMTNDEANLMSRTNNFMQDFLDQAIPGFIKNGFDGWNDYVARAEKFNPQQIVRIFQKYVG